MQCHEHESGFTDGSQAEIIHLSLKVDRSCNLHGHGGELPCNLHGHGAVVVVKTNASYEVVRRSTLKAVACCRKMHEEVGDRCVCVLAC